MAQNFLLNPQNLHFVLAIIMLVPFTLFVFWTALISWFHVLSPQKENRKAPEFDFQNLEEELKRELALFRQRRQEAQARQEEKTLQKEQDRQKHARMIQESETLMNRIKEFSFNPERGENAALFTLALDLISRQVEALKIAKILSFRFTQTFSKDEALEFMAGLKDFLALLGNSDEKISPTREKMLKGLLNGDVSYALQFLHQESKKNMEKAKQEQMPARQEAYRESSAHLACIYAVLSRFEDGAQTFKALSWALKVSPSNVVAWNLLGNLYLKDFKENEAFEAYENVLRFEADTPYQSANAHKILSLKSYASGDLANALKHYKEAQTFYNSIKINEELNQEDKAALDIIISRQNTQKLLEKLLKNRVEYKS